MNRAHVHLVAAITVWSSLYCAVAALGVRPGRAPTPPLSIPATPPGCDAPTAVRAGDGLGCDDEQRPEVVLARSQDWFALARAVRAEYERERVRRGNRAAFADVGAVLAQNPNITRVAIDQPYVRLSMPNRPDYVVYITTHD